MPSSSAREAFWRNLIERRAASRLTVVEACEQAGVTPASFFQWQRKFRASDRRPVQDAAQSTSLLPVRLLDDRIAELTLELPHGLRLRLPGDCDAATLGRVLQAALAACGEPLVIPFRVIVGQELADGVSRRLLTVEDHPGQTLPLDRPHESPQVGTVAKKNGSTSSCPPRPTCRRSVAGRA